MAGTPKARIYCALENDYFPAEQFIDDPFWGKVHILPHRHTVLGTLVNDGTVVTEADVDDVLGDDDEG